MSITFESHNFQDVFDNVWRGIYEAPKLYITDRLKYSCARSWKTWHWGSERRVGRERVRASPRFSRHAWLVMPGASVHARTSYSIGDFDILRAEEKNRRLELSLSQEIYRNSTRPAHSHKNFRNKDPYKSLKLRNWKRSARAADALEPGGLTSRIILKSLIFIFVFICIFNIDIDKAMIAGSFIIY
jgi:hypothetical protein